jgi:prephenate dehydrogenase
MGIGIVGLGQIGGSMLRRLSKYRPRITLYGTDVNSTIKSRMRPFGRWRSSLSEVVEECDILILALPVPEIMRTFPRIAECLRASNPSRRLIVLDTGTVKAPIVGAAAHFREWFNFAGLHPLAGTEKNGWAGSESRLFEGWRIVYCPSSSARANRVARAVIQLLGGVPLRMDAREHDRRLAEAICLPHVLAYSAARMGKGGKPNPLRGNSWYSLTRVTQSSPEMVAGFLKANREDLLPVLRRFQRNLSRIVSEIEHKHLGADPLARLLEGGKSHRS